MTGDRGEAPCNVRHRPRHHADRVGVDGERQSVGVGDAADGRTNARDAAESRRPPDRAAGVGSERNAAHAGCQCRRGAPARAAGYPCRIPGIQAVAVVNVVGRRAVTELGQIGLAEKDRARIADPSDHFGIRIGDVVPIHSRTEGGPGARDVEAVLDQHRHAVQEPEPLAVIGSLVGLMGHFERHLRGLGEDRIDFRIEALDHVEIALGLLDRVANGHCSASHRRESRTSIPQEFLSSNIRTKGTTDATPTASGRVLRLEGHSTGRCGGPQ